jgi:hypothetical protein
MGRRTRVHRMIDGLLLGCQWCHRGQGLAFMVDKGWPSCWTKAGASGKVNDSNPERTDTRPGRLQFLAFDTWVARGADGDYRWLAWPPLRSSCQSLAEISTS